MKLFFYVLSLPLWGSRRGCLLLQAPDYSQSHNRYSYVLNNPLKYIDPSGMEGRGYDWMENGMPYNYASRHDRLEMQRKNGTSYEAQHISKIYDLASLSGYRNQQGQNIIFGNGGLGYWEKNPISGYEYLTGSDFMNAPQNVSYYTNEQLARILFPSNEDWISLSVGEKHANRNALVGSRAGESINGRGQVYNTPRSGDNSGVEFSNNVMNVATLFFPIGRIATAIKGISKVDDVAHLAKSWLGREAKVVTNKAGDNIFMSKDGLRKIRFDVKNSHGDAPHVHLEKFINGKWRDAIPGTHRIYLK